MSNPSLNTDAERAYTAAAAAAAPFTPSPAQVEEALKPLVVAMYDMPEPQRRAYIAGTRPGTYAAVAIRMLSGVYGAKHNIVAR